MKNIETVGQLVDKLAKLPRKMKVWAGVPKEGGGFEPCLCISHVSADPRGTPGHDDCGLVLNPAAPYNNLAERTTPLYREGWNAGVDVMLKNVHAIYPIGKHRSFREYIEDMAPHYEKSAELDPVGKGPDNREMWRGLAASFRAYLQDGKVPSSL